MFDLVTIGDCTMDMYITIDDKDPHCSLVHHKQKVCFEYGQKICTTGNKQYPGGNAANVAVGTKYLGLNTAIITEWGDDIMGYAIQKELHKKRINTTHSKHIKKRETRYAIVLNYQNERTILSTHTPYPYQKPKIPETKWIYYTSLGASFEHIQKAVIKYKKKHKDTFLAVNPGSHQIQHGKNSILKILPYTDILIVNKEEAMELTNRSASLHALAQTLHTQGAHTVVITDGEHGSYAYSEAQLYHMPTFHTKPISKTGAGDAYSSGFLSAIIQKKNIQTAMQWGTANAAGVMQELGAQKGLLQKKGINTMIKKYKKIVPKKIM